jgi:anion transporter
MIRVSDRERAAKAIVLGSTLITFMWLSINSSITGRVLGVVLLALVLWSLYPKHLLASSILIIALLSLFEASLNTDAFVSSLFVSYGRSGLWIVVSGFILAEAMRVSGLGRRIALWIVVSLGGNMKSILLSVAVASLAVAPLSPSTTAKAFLILPICNGLIEAFGEEKGSSKFGAGVMLMAMAANNICSTGFLTGTVPNPIAAFQIHHVTGIDLNWSNWFWMGFPLTILLLFCSWWICRWMFKSEVKNPEEPLRRIMDLRREAGPLKRSEIIVAILFATALLLWITEPLLGLNVGIVSVLLALVVFLPRIGVLKMGGFAGAVPWGPIAIFAASTFLANAIGRWRALDPVALIIFNGLDFAQIPHPFFVSLTVLVSMLLHVGFTSTTVYATIMIPLTIALAQIHELQPQLVAIPLAFLAPVSLILPINTIPNIIFYSSGWFTQRQIIKYGLLTSLISVLLVLTVGMLYWQYLGLIDLNMGWY